MFRTLVATLVFSFLAAPAMASTSEESIRCVDLMAGPVRWLPDGASEVAMVGEGGFAFFDTTPLIPTELRAAIGRLPLPLLSGINLKADGSIRWPGDSPRSTRAERMNWYVPQPLDFFPRSAEGLAWIAARNADADLIERDLPAVAAALAAKALSLLPAEERGRVHWNQSAFIRAQDSDDDGGSVHTDGMYYRASIPVFNAPTWIVDDDRNVTWAAHHTWAATFSGTQRLRGRTRHVAPITRGLRVTLFLDFEP